MSLVKLKYSSLYVISLCCLQQDQSIYQQKVKDMIADGEVRLVVNINDLRKKNPKRAAE